MLVSLSCDVSTLETVGWIWAVRGGDGFPTSQLRTAQKSGGFPTRALSSPRQGWCRTVGCDMEHREGKEGIFKDTL